MSLLLHDAVLLLLLLLDQVGHSFTCVGVVFYGDRSVRTARCFLCILDRREIHMLASETDAQPIVCNA